MRKTKGFTLIELLVVMAIIALLVSILAPSLTKILAQAKHRICQTNLDAIRKSMLAFASDNRDFFPNQGNTQTEILLNFALEVSLKGKQFVCPAVENDLPLDVRENGDFNNQHGSYSYQARYTGNLAGVNSDTNSAVVFIGDRTPLGVSYNWAGGNQLRDAEEIGDSAMKAMSQNHEEGEFMMVASKGGTNRVKRADVGDRRDNVFTTFGSASTGTTRQGGTPASFGTQIRDRQDSCLIPLRTSSIQP